MALVLFSKDRVCNQIMNVDIYCCRCNVVINCFSDAHKVSVTEETCEECQSAILDVNFNKVSLTMRTT